MNKKLDEVKNAQRKALLKSYQIKIFLSETKIKDDEETLEKLFSILFWETVSSKIVGYKSLQSACS